MLSNRSDMFVVRDRVEELAGHIEDISCAQDDMTKALITIYRDIRKIAQHNNIRLDPPLINMNVENGNISAAERKTFDAELDEIEVIDGE